MPRARVRIEVHVGEADLEAALRADVRRGLAARPRSIPPKYFYDEAGSRLFEAITQLPEYYLTRSETALLRRHALRLVGANRATDLVELGSGNSRKTRMLLAAMRSQGTLRRFVPIDISAPALRRMASGLARSFPTLEIHGIAGDFEKVLGRIPDGGRRLIAFLGSTIGNLDRRAAVALLRRVSRMLDPEDRFLLGTDLVKSPRRLEAAYNDASGVTARFNRNLLRVLNRRLGADFVPRRFEHVAFFNRNASRIEMHLRSREDQSVRIAKLGLSVRFRKGETLHTENSYKYTRPMVASMLEEAGLALSRWILAPDRLFAVSLSCLTR
jgi:L-histidine N-alpha-methyltransferase